MNYVISSGQSRAQSIAPIPITYYEASLIYIDYRAPFSFIHRDPMDGSVHGHITLCDPVTFIPAVLWDSYSLCGACGEYTIKHHSCPERQ